MNDTLVYEHGTVKLNPKTPVKRITTKRGLYRAIKATVLAEEHYNQHVWLSSGFFREEGTYRASNKNGDQLREILSRNLCNTTGCVAGTAIILTMLPTEVYDYIDDTVEVEDGYVFAQTYAAEKMGLRETEADWLFNADRTKGEVLTALDLLIAGRRLTSIMPKVSKRDRDNDW